MSDFNTVKLGQVGITPFGKIFGEGQVDPWITRDFPRDSFLRDFTHTDVGEFMRQARALGTDTVTQHRPADDQHSQTLEVDFKQNWLNLHTNTPRIHHILRVQIQPDTDTPLYNTMEEKWKLADGTVPPSQQDAFTAAMREVAPARAEAPVEGEQPLSGPQLYEAQANQLSAYTVQKINELQGVTLEAHQALHMKVFMEYVRGQLTELAAQAKQEGDQDTADRITRIHDDSKDALTHFSDLSANIEANARELLLYKAEIARECGAIMMAGIQMRSSMMTSQMYGDPWMNPNNLNVGGRCGGGWGGGWGGGYGGAYGGFGGQFGVVPGVVNNYGLTTQNVGYVNQLGPAQPGFVPHFPSRAYPSRESHLTNEDLERLADKIARRNKSQDR